jgi:hypothetical protein
MELAGWLTDCLAGWLVGWLVGWLFEWLVKAFWYTCVSVVPRILSLGTRRNFAVNLITLLFTSGEDPMIPTG